MSPTKFVPNTTFKSWSFSINLYNYDAKYAPSAIDLYQIVQKSALSAPLQQMVQIRCHKGAGTEMNKCLVG